jgi:tetratricopeptide (TPR) repeat protein
VTVPVVDDLRRAELLTDIGRWDEARAVLARVIAAQPQSVRALCLLAYCHQGLGEYEPMRRYAEDALAADPSDQWAHRLAGYAAGRLGDVATAVRAAEEAVRLDPGDWRNHHFHARALRWDGDRRGALDAARKAVELSPDSAATHTMLGCVLHDLRRPRRAVRALRAALAVAPGDADALEALGHVYLGRGRLLGALRAFAAAGRQRPTADAPLVDVGRALRGLLMRLFALALAVHVAVAGLAWNLPGAWAARAVAGSVLLAGYALVVRRLFRAVPAGARVMLTGLLRRHPVSWLTVLLLGSAALESWLPAGWYPRTVDLAGIVVVSGIACARTAGATYGQLLVNARQDLRYLRRRGRPTR